MTARCAKSQLSVEIGTEPGTETTAEKRLSASSITAGLTGKRLPVRSALEQLCAKVLVLCI